jgi:hypothetical protein
METINVILGIIGLVNTLMIFYLGTLEKRLSNMQAKLDKTAEKEEVNKIINLEIKAVLNEQKNQKEDLLRIEDKLDKILQKR